MNSTVYQSLIVALVLRGRRDTLLNRLQSVLNSAGRSIAGLRRSAHIIDTLANFHWLCAPKRIHFTQAVLVYRALHGTAPRYLSNLLRRVADVLSRSRSRLRSSSTSRLDVRPSCRVTVGDRSFAVAGSRIWNRLPIATSLRLFLCQSTAVN